MAAAFLPTRKYRVVIPKFSVSFAELMSKYSDETDQFLKKDKTRDNHYQAFFKALLAEFNKFDNFTARYIRASIVANNIEEFIFEECENDITLFKKSKLTVYLTKCLTVIKNLYKATNPEISKGLYYSTISAKELINMKAYEYLNKEEQINFLKGSRKLITNDYSINLCLNKDDEATIDGNGYQ